MTRTPPEVILWIAAWEGLRLTPGAVEVAGRALHIVGYGHTVTESEPHLLSGVTRLQAGKILLADITRFEDVVRRCEPRGKSLPPCKLGALVSLAMSIGPSLFWGSNLYRNWLKTWKWLGREAEAGEEFLRWVREGQEARRAEERELWLREG